MQKSISVMAINAAPGRWRLFVGLLVLVLGFIQSAKSEVGVDDSVIRLGTVLDLQGDSRGLGRGMRNGLEAAFRGKTVKGRTIDLVALNDNYSPPKTAAATKELLARGVFAMVGNVGTPTAKRSLPLLAEQGVPAVGFFTGAGILRPGVGQILNFRASYVQETAAVIQSALRAGLPRSSVCAYVQNDAYGMAGVEGIKIALEGFDDTTEIVEMLDSLIRIEGGENPARNNLGPVGVYQRNTLHVRPGYESLKNWERVNGTRCRLVVSVGTYQTIARFAAYARYQGDDWIVSAVSFTGAENFRNELIAHEVNDGIVMTQVVPLLDAELPIVDEAREALGDDFGYVSLEGYIVGRMVLDALKRIKGELTRNAFVQSLRGQRFQLGGLKMDFRTDNQGSDLVVLTYMAPDGYRAISAADWRTLTN